LEWEEDKMTIPNTVDHYGQLGKEGHNHLRYVINPPKLAGAQVLYRKIIVSVLENDKIIGAYEFDLDGNYKPVSYKDIEFHHPLSTYFKSVVTPGAHNITGNVRTFWVFDTLEKAFIQKLILLDYLRKYFYSKMEEDKNFFDTKIPKQVSEKVQEIQNTKPEYFL
jgi:hypothetical protein